MSYVFGPSGLVHQFKTHFVSTLDSDAGEGTQSHMLVFVPKFKTHCNYMIHILVAYFYYNLLMWTNNQYQEQHSSLIFLGN